MNKTEKDEVAKYFCNICTFHTLTKGYLKKHIEKKHKERPKCEQCGNQFKTLANLESHIKLRHSGAKYFCGQCDYQTVLVTANGTI